MKREPVEVKVLGQQNITEMCLVCGEKNGLGLHAHFYNLEDGSIAADFSTSDEHQSYPGRVHGGIISAILDEAIGRAVQNRNPEIWGVTVELNVKFRKPVPLGESLRVVARIDKQTSRVFDGSGELLLPDGEIAAQATARYASLPVATITKGGLSPEEWHDDPHEYPEKVINYV